MGVCRITIFNKGIAILCSFFVVPGNVSALFRMPGCEGLQVVSTNCHTTYEDQEGRQISKQTR